MSSALAALVPLALAASPTATQAPRPVFKPSVTGTIRSTPDPRTANVRVVPPPKPERKKLTPAQVASVRKASAEATRARKVAACKAANGAWSAEIRGRELFGEGSDVDEIYGRIFATASDGGTYYPSHRGPGWVANDLWTSNNKNIDLGGKGYLNGFPPMTIRNLSGAERHPAKIYIHFNLHDEDDGRGGSNDENFLAYGPIGFYNGPGNSMAVPQMIEDCDTEPEFRVGYYYSMFGSPPSHNDSNKLTFRFSILFVREFP